MEVEGVDTKTLETDSEDSESENEVRRSVNPPPRDCEAKDRYSTVCLQLIRNSETMHD